MEEIEELDPAVMKEVEGIALLGDVSDDVTFAGHTWGLRTLRAAEEIAAGKVIEPFRNTIKEPEAWAAAQIGLALTHIDGDYEFCPQVGPNMQSFAKARMNYITTEWHFIVIDFLFREYAKLLEEQLSKVRRIQDLSTGSLLSSWPSEDSFKEQGILNDETIEETLSTPA